MPAGALPWSVKKLNLSKLLRRYTKTDSPLPYALADYNAGRGNVLKWNGGEAATNSVLFIDASYTTGAVWPSDLKAQFAAYSVEKPWRDERIGPQVKLPVPSPARLRRTRAA